MLWTKVASVWKGLRIFWLNTGISGLNPLMLKAAKTASADTLSKTLKVKITLGNISRIDVSHTTLPTNLFKIFYEVILNFQVIVKSIKDADDNLSRISLASMG